MDIGREGAPGRTSRTNTVAPAAVDPLIPRGIAPRESQAELPTPTAVDFRNDESLLAFLEANLDSGEVTAAIERATCERRAQAGDLLLVGKDGFFVVGERADGGLYGWHPSGCVEAVLKNVPTCLSDQTLVDRVQLVQELETVTARWGAREDSLLRGEAADEVRKQVDALSRTFGRGAALAWLTKEATAELSVASQCDQREDRIKAEGRLAELERLREAAPFPERTLAVLRERLDLAPTDTRRDNELKTYSPQLALEEMLAWELGSPNWASTMLRWANNCGYSIAEHLQDNRHPGWAQRAVQDVATDWIQGRSQEALTRLASLPGLEAAAVTSKVLESLAALGAEHHARSLREALQSLVS